MDKDFGRHKVGKALKKLAGRLFVPQLVIVALTPDRGDPADLLATDLVHGLRSVF